MKVLILTISHWKDRPSGSARIAFDEAVELRRRGQEVWMLSKGRPSLPEHEIADGIHLLRYAERRVAPWNPVRAFVHQRAVTAILEKHLPKVDVVHGHVPLSSDAAFRFYGNAAHFCYTIHSPSGMEMAIEWKNSGLARRLTTSVGISMLNRIEATCLTRAQVVTALSQYTKDCLREIHGAKVADRILVIPGWVDTGRFVPLDDRHAAKQRLGWPTDRPVLFSLRRLTARMGLDRLLDACHHILSEGIRFHLVLGGDGPLRKTLEQQAERLGISGSISFAGRVSDDLLPLAYGACDAFVLPTAALECFGIIALEAFSAGRPVLATPIGAIPEILRKFEPEWLAQSAQVGDITSLLRRYLKGELPDHSPAFLHDKVHQGYNSARRLDEFLDTTVGGSLQSPPLANYAVS